MSTSKKPLKPDDFPVTVEGQKIKKQDGKPIARRSSAEPRKKPPLQVGRRRLILVAVAWDIFAISPAILTGLVLSSCAQKRLSL